MMSQNPTITGRIANTLPELQWLSPDDKALAYAEAYSADPITLAKIAGQYPAPQGVISMDLETLDFSAPELRIMANYRF
jgi:hypothetical protein